ncbi:MAG: hypothetical protein JGK17_08955 [Microcoleus sp. PH2017_10_PVI_O_A]|uniref:DUF6391 domain-containing protein n=1 Tax=unclassified Microcoleus TaxID=2642155 RepID=UPI001E0AD69C|nr:MULTISPECIES: DUF6391 domain-containing protein [unclassified Microcoleus]TAE83953.1 MAG: hypothetical protein EAZ83_07875 [Oscillatoriales cyanobacterium]MCC3405707.1 hypothetical protein [Microcoleus sp. PH2017_10_PVI_O_A]MCC3460863.1 hypothetical protein [Microcoleus sp. PH2017_11_PCY_U_A]MCC3478172.1 hypothetical protein [Microcoleus sp. PH2017_12_PCY_D_A]MCC3527361.1 hypothetical protein [Microcoleus sp. PH2017_21_RUC_O_A]
MTTNAASSSGHASQIPFDFAPQRTQDADLLRQLDFVPGLKEILTLRQVHALEHATVWVLGQSVGTPAARADNQLLGGMSTDQGFYLYGRVNIAQLRHAVQLALQRIASGEWDLAVHPRCGTNLSVAMLLTAGLAVGINLALPKGPILQLLGLGAAAATAAQLAPDVGALAQRYVTTAIPFNLSIVDISVSHDFWGREAHFVRVRWVQ